MTVRKPNPAPPGFVPLATLQKVIARQGGLRSANAALAQQVAAITLALSRSELLVQVFIAGLPTSKRAAVIEAGIPLAAGFGDVEYGMLVERVRAILAD